MCFIRISFLFKETYSLACQGNLPVPEVIKSALKCYYETYKRAFLKIGPIKVEELYLDPKIVKIHDAIWDSEIEKLIDISKERVNKY